MSREGQEGRRIEPDLNRNATAKAASELVRLQQECEQARVTLAQLQQDTVKAKHHLESIPAAQLLEANEELVLAMLRAQTDAETVARNITHRELAAELWLEGQRLEAENRQVQETSRLKSEFLSNMSHELRTPLNAVIGFADLLLSGAVPPRSTKYDEYVSHIANSGRHLLGLITDLLDLSAIEAGQLKFSPQPVNLRQVVEEVTDTLNHSACGNGLAVITQVDADLTDLVLDPLRLKQVLYNYISNAIKFTPEGGRVTICANTEGAEHFRVAVEDTGIGISAADQARLFVQFQQLGSGRNKKHQGTGLGLALTRRLVEAQGGSVGVRSTPGVGSEFYFVLKRDLGVAVSEFDLHRN